MRTVTESHHSIFGVTWDSASALIGIINSVILIFVVAFVVLTAQSAQGQTYGVLYKFSGGLDGSQPWGQLAMDAAGSLYVAAESGAADKLIHTPGGWVVQPLYDFNSSGDGTEPQIVLAPNGVVFGATQFGGTEGCGNVFELRPSPTFPRTPLAPWNETILYQFLYGFDGCRPASAPIIDPAGNLYGTTSTGGYYGLGTVYELARSGQTYTEQLVYSFEGGNDGDAPFVGLIADNSFTNLYGVTWGGGSPTGCNYAGCGTVFKLTNTGSGWTESILYSFQADSDGKNPSTGLALDSSGNLYGATSVGGVGGGGTIFKLTPSGGAYTFSVLYSFTAACNGLCGPTLGAVTLDAAGSIYGTTFAQGAQNQGSAFELSPTGEGYTYTDLHDFTWGAGGAHPEGGIIRDPRGNLYGTTISGGSNACGLYGCGVIWEITP
jgi:uncharacterized repeat protein (TIGR03803 family)